MSEPVINIEFYAKYNGPTDRVYVKIGKYRVGIPGELFFDKMTPVDEIEKGLVSWILGCSKKMDDMDDEIKALKTEIRRFRALEDALEGVKWYVQRERD